MMNKKTARSLAELCPWKFDGKPVNSITEMPAETVGFVYIVESRTTGAYYIGKKQIWSKRKASPSANRRTTIESDWATYWTSSSKVKDSVETDAVTNEALGLAQDGWTRTILAYCNQLGALTYTEQYFQVVLSVLDDKNCMCDNVGMFRRLNKNAKIVYSSQAQALKTRVDKVGESLKMSTEQVTGSTE